MMIRLHLLLIPCLALTVALGPPAHAGGKKDRPAPYRLDQLRSPDTSAALIHRARGLFAEQSQALEAAKARGDGKRDLDAIEGNLDILTFTERRLRQLLQSSPSERVLFESNAYAERTLQGVEVPVEGETFPPFYDLFMNTIVGGLSGHSVPGVSERQQHRPMGKSRAKRESAFLYEKGREDFFSVKELAALTPEEASALDISPNHPNWYDREAFAAIRHDPLGHFEQFMESGATNALREKGDLPAGRYDIQTAQRVLFLDYIFKSATTPKGQVRDAFGGTWKIKWGPEASVESVTWQLYILAGARITDVVLTSGAGPAAMTLILMDADEAAAKKPSPVLRYPSSVDELKAVSLELYGFDLTPYIHSSGVITPGNVDAVLRNLPASGKSEYRKSRLIGRNWVAFRETSIELSMEGFVRRADGLRLSDVLAANDRVARGSFIFDMWVGNRDVKDDNSDAFFPMNAAGTITSYREGRHDQGLTLGSLTAAGDVNQFDVGRSFAKRGLFGKIRFYQSIIFEPEAYDTATWADCKWMARHLAAITDAEIRQAVTASQWPDFAQQALAYRLINRRDQITNLFGVTTGSGLAAPSMAVALGTPGEIRAAERRYGLPEGALTAELASQSVPTGPGYAETVLYNGVITSGLDSALVRALTRHLYPSGLASRLETSKDNQPPRCLEP